MPALHAMNEALWRIEATGWCAVLMGGGYAVGWLRWGMK